ncbi:MAG TPA: biotin--[acetyl-CoA-carboxylase] ligase [Clostridiales bacterium UBA8960]|jgi:BirA family biotin operon repressor/biotin-[acetyl-CoA-carboxylase] ligase|nr:biotin--[acetyl-CoA-carboxylase] ligase [Clostridiales bacterium UBA8960]
MKAKILNLLREHSDQYLSGEQLSENLGVSRAAIWKHIKTLKAEGYKIDSISNKGYRLLSDTHSIQALSLTNMVELYDFLDFGFHYESIDSTNTEAKRFAINDDSRQGLFVADEQKQGKGRLGRSWVSEKKAGLWFSMLLRPSISPEKASGITLVAAAAMSMAIEAQSSFNVGIKWPNDLLLGDKKVCGILTEMSAELNHLHYLILGIGVNLDQNTFEDDLSNKATSIKMAKGQVSAKALLEAFLKHFSVLYKSFVLGRMEDVIQYHKTKSVTLNRQVTLTSPSGMRQVYAIDLDDMGSLVIVNENKELETIISGEVSVRGVNGYI